MCFSSSVKLCKQLLFLYIYSERIWNNTQRFECYSNAILHAFTGTSNVGSLSHCYKYFTNVTIHLYQAGIFMGQRQYINFYYFIWIFIYWSAKASVFRHHPKTREIGIQVDTINTFHVKQTDAIDTEAADDIWI